MIRILPRARLRPTESTRALRANSTQKTTPLPNPRPYKKRPAPASKVAEQAPTEPAQKPTGSFTSFFAIKRPWRAALWTLNSFIALHLYWTYVGTIQTCIGPSMLPTLNYKGDWVYISKLHASMRWLKVGDLVSFQHPVRRGNYAIKRVVAMPGDFVLRDTPGKDSETMVRVPPGHCWVTGDNLDGSRDSRMFGALSLTLVKGKVLCRVWPSPTVFSGNITDPVYLDEDDED